MRGCKIFARGLKANLARWKAEHDVLREDFTVSVISDACPYSCYRDKIMKNRCSKKVSIALRIAFASSARKEKEEIIWQNGNETHLFDSIVFASSCVCAIWISRFAKSFFTPTKLFLMLKKRHDDVNRAKGGKKFADSPSFSLPPPQFSHEQTIEIEFVWQLS